MLTHHIIFSFQRVPVCYTFLHNKPITKHFKVVYVFFAIKTQTTIDEQVPISFHSFKFKSHLQECCNVITQKENKKMLLFERINTTQRSIALEVIPFHITGVALLHNSVAKCTIEGNAISVEYNE